MSTEKTISMEYKTKICRLFKKNKSCKNGENCLFAHGQKELFDVSSLKSAIIAEIFDSNNFDFGSNFDNFKRSQKATGVLQEVITQSNYSFSYFFNFNKNNFLGKM